MGCVERPVETSDPIALERHIFAVHSDGGGAGAKLDQALLREGRQGPAPRPDDPCRLETIGELEPSEQLRRQFVCTMRNAATFRTAFIKQHPERADEPLRLAFYFNGGLNSPAAVRGTAAASWRQAEADGVYPIYMIWPTGGFSTWAEDTTRVRNGRHLNRPNYVTGGFHVFGDVLSGIGRTPDAWTGSFEEFADAGFGLGSPEFTLRPTDDERRVLNGGITADRNLVFSENVDTRPGSIGPTTSARGPVGYVYFAATSPFRALSTPLVVGFGHTMWENMVRRTRTSIRQVAEFPITELDPAERQRWLSDLGRFPRGAGGFARFFQWLESCIAGRPTIAGSDGCPLDELSGKLTMAPGQENPKTMLANARIDMLGHSMGAIVINELLETFPRLPYENVVYMAGAASIRDTHRAIAPVLQAAPGCTHFFNLSLHPMNEARESSSAALPSQARCWCGSTSCSNGPRHCSTGPSGSGAMYAWSSACFRPSCSPRCYSGYSTAMRAIHPVRTIPSTMVASTTRAYRSGDHRSGGWTRRSFRRPKAAAVECAVQPCWPTHAELLPLP